MITRERCHILCVDDEATVLEWLESGLSASGYSVDIAQNGFTALRKVTKHPARFSVIITDLRMPGMDGFEFIEQSRAAGYDGKFLIYASAVTSDAQQRSRELRVERVIEKPVHRRDLIAAVEELQSGL